MEPHLEIKEEGVLQTSSTAQPDESNFSETQKNIFDAKKKVIINLVVISVALEILFTAYNGLNMLQSTLNQQGGIGVASQAIIYAVFCISALLLPKYTIKNLGCKRALLLSVVSHIPYIAANFYFNWFIVVPTAVLKGLVAPILSSSQSTYLNELSVTYTDLCLSGTHEQHGCTKENALVKKSTEEILEEDVDNDNLNAADVKQKRFQKLDTLYHNTCKNEAGNKFNEFISNADVEKEIEETKKESCGNKLVFTISKSKDVCLSVSKNISNLPTFDSAMYSDLLSSTAARFFGFFNLMHQSSEIWGNLMTFYVLNDSQVHDNITENDTCKCGATFCNLESECFSHNLAEPNQYMRNMLAGVSVLLVFVSVILVFLFLDELEGSKQRMRFSLDLAMATSKCMRKKEVLLLFPLAFFDGLQDGFYIGDFTKSYIACAWGVHHVGLVTACFGIGMSISSILSGLTVKYTGRIPVILTGVLINAILCIYLFVWIPLPDHPYIFFTWATMWGASIGILWSQETAFFGVIFQGDKTNEEAAFAAFYTWNAVGYCVAYSYNDYICTYIKIYILLAVSAVAAISYLKTEFIYKQKIRESQLI